MRPMTDLKRWLSARPSILFVWSGFLTVMVIAMWAVSFTDPDGPHLTVGFWVCTGLLILTAASACIGAMRSQHQDSSAFAALVTRGGTGPRPSDLPRKNLWPVSRKSR